MKSSRAITLTLLSATMLTACCCVLPRNRARDLTWYDANRHPIEPQWTTTVDGKRVPAVTPHDHLGRPWVQDADGEWRPLDAPAGSTSSGYHRRTSFWPLFFSSSPGSSY